MKIRYTPLLFVVCILSVFIPAKLAAQWVPAQGIDAYVKSLAASGTTIFAGTNKGIYQSTDHGANWTAKWLPNIDVNSMVISGNNFIAGTNSGIYLSENNGANWNLADNSPSDYYAVSGSYVFAGAGTYVLRSSDNGKTWSKLDIGLQSYASITALAVNGQNIVASSYGDGIRYSTDNGANWKNDASGVTNIIFRSLSASGNADVYGGGWNAGVYRSTDNGKNWACISSGTAAAGTLVYSVAVSGNLIFMGAENKGAFETVNGGTNWFSINTGLPNSGNLCTPMAMITSGSNLVAGINTTTANSAGVWIRPLAELTTSVDDKAGSVEPAGFSLGQNYPNPFNPATAISYVIPKQSYIELKVSDILGHEVTSLVNKEQSAGEYKVTFDGSSLPSGIYIYTIQAGEFRDSKKLMILK